MTDKDFRDMLDVFIESSESDLCRFIEGETSRFPSNGSMLARYRRAFETCFERGPSSLNQFMEAHNEVCVAVALLQADNGEAVCRLEYEPPLCTTDRRFDFFIQRNDNKRLWIEVKSIRPERRDAWSQFTSIKNRELLSERTEIIIFQGLGGGELWHDWMAGRSKMLEYCLQTEEKIKLAGAEVRDDICVLCFCMRAHQWNKSHLEDFVSYYRSGEHRYDDAFGKMERHHLDEKSPGLSQTIHDFILLERDDLAVRWNKTTWKVQPPLW